MRASARRQSGLTYLELVATTAILMVLASAVLPLARVTVKRQKELELRRALREIRTAIDNYKKSEAEIGSSDKVLGSEGYPAKLEKLVEGVAKVGTIGGKLKFLRRIPKDPMTNSIEWGQRCYQDAPDDESWCGSNVWDVYSKSEGTGLDGTPYKEW